MILMSSTDNSQPNSSHHTPQFLCGPPQAGGPPRPGGPPCPNPHPRPNPHPHQLPRSQHGPNKRARMHTTPLPGGPPRPPMCFE